ncbi:hypothetical protein [Microvirga arabica]|uniref:hypothetical protein n=1 Tax=Microvirga arabica TaxID=1128671 RepID=UPI001939F623|nr:hypothetical protein [Microvirga arabica]MBM1172666.1 hypothetical protein [Microvirga arabica]
MAVRAVSGVVVRAVAALPLGQAPSGEGARQAEAVSAQVAAPVEVLAPAAV